MTLLYLKQMRAPLWRDITANRAWSYQVAEVQDDPKEPPVPMVRVAMRKGVKWAQAFSRISSIQDREAIAKAVRGCMSSLRETMAQE